MDRIRRKKVQNRVRKKTLREPDAERSTVVGFLPLGDTVEGVEGVAGAVVRGVEGVSKI